MQALRRQPNRSHIRTREAHGRELTYLEGWYVISEANRIFGFDGWSRETVESKCVLARENRGTFLAVYTARVRLTVQADGATIIREGHGTGEGRGPSPGEVHDIALKAAETDATKRALATFGRPFGLELYRGGRAAASQKPLPAPPSVPAPVPADARLDGFHPDDTTPIPRPSRYYGRRQDLVTRDRAQGRRDLDVRPSAGSSVIVPVSPSLVPGQSTRAFSPSPSPNGCVTRPICGSSPRNLVSSAAGSRAIRITCGLRSRERWVSRSATSSPFPFAAVIITSCTRPAMK